MGGGQLRCDICLNTRSLQFRYEFTVQPDFYVNFPIMMILFIIMLSFTTTADAITYACPPPLPIDKDKLKAHCCYSRAPYSNFTCMYIEHTFCSLILMFQGTQ